nr:hypothetical protein [Fervidicoccus fontis]
MQTLRIDPAEPWKGIPAIAQKIREVCGDRRIVVEAGGGLRGITVMLMLALFSMKRSFSVETSIEGDRFGPGDTGGFHPIPHEQTRHEGLPASPSRVELGKHERKGHR